MPESVINVDKTKLSTTETLDKYVVINQMATGVMDIVIKNEAGQTIFELDGMILAEYMNYIKV